MEENFFKAAREKKGISQFDAAVKIGVSAGAISGWERGQTPAIRLADKIASVYGLSISKVLVAMHEMASAKAEAVSK